MSALPKLAIVGGSWGFVEEFDDENGEFSGEDEEIEGFVDGNWGIVEEIAGSVDEIDLKAMDFSVSVGGIGCPLSKTGFPLRKIKALTKEFFPLTKKSPGPKWNSSAPAKGIRMMLGIFRAGQPRIWLRT